jgi:hypothetical protein
LPKPFPKNAKWLSYNRDYTPKQLPIAKARLPKGKNQPLLFAGMVLLSAFWSNYYNLIHWNTDTKQINGTVLGLS